MMKRILCVLFAVMLLAGIGMGAGAVEVPDMNKTGTISVILQDGGKGVPGGTLTIYRVGEIVEDDGNYSFALTDAFAGSKASLEDLNSAALPVKLEEYAEEKKIEGVTEKVSDKGLCEFGTDKGLELGLYLIVQKEAGEGYNPVNSFLVSLPQYEDGKYIYNVDASPKVDDSVPVPTTKPVEPTKPSGSKLPQTGQLNWPVPMLVMLGLGVFAAGWYLRFGKKPEEYEK